MTRRDCLLHYSLPRVFTTIESFCNTVSQIHIRPKITLSDRKTKLIGAFDLITWL